MTGQTAPSGPPPLIGCIEAGGTKWNLAVVRAPDDIVRQERIATTDPEATLAQSVAFFESATGGLGALAAIGIGSFGPVDVRLGSPTWGRILATPKPGWTDADVVAPFARRFGCPIGFDTDVNAAVLAESWWGAAQGCGSAVYVTVGTGIGGGALIEGALVHGARHPEMGHVPVRRHADDRDFAGSCPFHGDCLEGLASGPAILKRWGCSLSDLPPDHPGHGIVAFYLAQLAIMQFALLSTERIVFGGGVLATPGLLPLIRDEAERLAAGYFGEDDWAALIVPPKLGDRSGLLGAFALGQRALEPV